MAKEKQDWKSALRSAQQEGDRQNDKLDIARKKKQSTVMYKKRKLDKDIKRYIKDNDPIKYKEIERIQRDHKI